MGGKTADASESTNCGRAASILALRPVVADAGLRKAVTLLPIEYLQKISREAQTRVKAWHSAQC
jgi:hypothetical protein